MGRGAPFGNTNAAGQQLTSKNVGNKYAAKKEVGVRIAAFAAKHGPPAYVAADQVLKKNAENDEQAHVAAGQKY